ncbi:MAG: hypothetical protein ACTSVE_04115, partial [Candidatus Helarchaeota archaeon]
TRIKTSFLDICGYIEDTKTIDLIPFNYYNDDIEFLYVGSNIIILYNSSKENFFSEIYNITSTLYFENYAIIDDLDSDNIPEIAVNLENQKIAIFSGANGTIINSFPIDIDYSNEFKIIGSKNSLNMTYLFISGDKIIGGTRTFQNISIYSISKNSHKIEYSSLSEVIEDERKFKIYPLNCDVNGDGVNEVLIWKELQPLFSLQKVSRFIIFDFKNKEELGIINQDYGIESALTINDINQDGRPDILINSWRTLFAFSSEKPIGFWLSPYFPLGVPIFIVLLFLSIFGFVMILLLRNKIRINKESIKKSKLSVAVNVIVIVLMTLTFTLFLAMVNIFNRTLITGDPMTNIVITFLFVTITWYVLLPLTAAIYNAFAPTFAFIFIKLRKLFFKFSRGYQHKILVEDLSDKQQLTTIVKLKKVILPLLLSISIGFYAYNSLSPILGFPQGFDEFNGTDFFKFLNGYALLCLFPMVLTFVIFSFLFSGNFLLDDAGLIYVKISKKVRSPTDIEPISIWAQSFIKGIAGFSAIITFIQFFTTIDLSGFFKADEIIFMLFGFFFVSVLFAGLPFLTAFSYILLSLEILEFSLDHNKEKLYKLMEKDGIDATPVKISTITTIKLPENQNS